MKKLTFIFLSAFALNFVWENLHAVLYANYKNGPITEWILLRATFWDALMLTALALLFIKANYFRKRQWWMLVFGIALGVAIEMWALGTHRWAYAPAMPTVFGIGLSPALQLGISGYIVLKAVLKWESAAQRA
jgi:hypothetical protein